ncbi:Tubulin polyglutamylase TTLL5 [Hondaea fermentalgiana]|uniref:Tubulin polyglutamylase TTLL5 n=1 Tax=Hondaea fermentalgiana TaxID=2315210 RepID=A0A2R5GQD2_9STRA|nr:Tubulin polyglutamylase TTLL5 [Hondaea fermentalgiana]|eukprot:GBG33082.1 Tubulin polyglutamylase TTLL5 [Hondaea fermentalgiana]
MASMSSASQGGSEVELLEYARREQREITRRLEALEASERVSRMLCSGHVPAIAELNIVPDGTSEDLQAKLKLKPEGEPGIHGKDEGSSSRTNKSCTSHTTRWERERQERVARAEALAREMRQRKKVDSGLSRENQSYAQSTGDVNFDPQNPRRRREEEEEEDDEDVVALEEAIEEEKAANEDAQDSSRDLENFRASLVSEREIDAESDGDDSASAISGRFDDSGRTGEGVHGSDISADKEDDALGRSITPPQATAESKEPLVDWGVNEDFSGLKISLDQAKTENNAPEQQQRASAKFERETGNKESKEEPANNSERVLEGLGGLVVDYSDHFTCFGDIFSVYASQDLRKANRAQVLSDVLAHTIETFSQTNKALALELCPEDSTQWLEMSANRFFRVLSKSRHEVFNIVRDAGLKLDTLGVEDSVSLVESKLRESTGEMSKKVALTARTPMTLLPQWAGAVWNLLWTWSKPKINRETLLRWQRVNHFRTARTLTRKDLLKKELQRYRSMSKFLSHEFELLPDTFILPKEYLQFVDAFAKYGEQEPDGNFWIMKPVGLSRGRGISLVSDIGDVCYGQSVIIQRYVSNPMLLDGYKFDLRIYVLVTSFQPLEAWIYDEGFVRVCTHKYSSASIDIHNLFIHLTNSSIQKMGPNGAGTKATAASISRHQAEIDEAGGTKLSLSYLWRRLGAQGLDVEKIQSAIKQLILKSLVCCDQSMDNDPNSFELFGYDVLLDENVRPWLIEVNSSPSLAQENQLDSKIKRKLIADTLRLERGVKIAAAKRQGAGGQNAKSTAVGLGSRGLEYLAEGCNVKL